MYNQLTVHELIRGGGMDGISVHAGLGWFIVVLGAAHAVIVFKELQTY